MHSCVRHGSLVAGRSFPSALICGASPREREQLNYGLRASRDVAAPRGCFLLKSRLGSGAPRSLRSVPSGIDPGFPNRIDPTGKDNKWDRSHPNNKATKTFELASLSEMSARLQSSISEKEPEISKE